MNSLSGPRVYSIDKVYERTSRTLHSYYVRFLGMNCVHSNVKTCSTNERRNCTVYYELPPYNVDGIRNLIAADGPAADPPYESSL